MSIEERNRILTKKRWLVLVACCAANLALGAFFAWSVFAGPMAERLNALQGTSLSAADLAIVFSLANGVGVVDSDYRGEIMVGLINNTDEDYAVSVGERVAQMMFVPVAIADFVEADTLSDTDRGSGGFGSTGRK